jgi:hypothetical protein
MKKMKNEKMGKNEKNELKAEVSSTDRNMKDFRKPLNN